MAELPKYHVREQEAYALLDPIRSSLGELERRTRHYLDRVAMGATDRATIEEAQRALASAHAEVERLWQSSDTRTAMTKSKG